MSDWHEEYRKRYKQLKEAGKPFFPYTVFKDTVFILILMAALCFLARHFGAELEDLADPTDTTYNPRPEWYFLFMFQALKFFPGNLEAVAAVVLPGAGIGALLLLPFLDRGPRRHPFERPGLTLLGVGALCGWGALTYAGWKAPMTNPSVERDPVAARGSRLYRDLSCAYCHSVRGKGGKIGPDLDSVFDSNDEAWLRRHFKDPQAATPGSKMPKLNLLDDEIDGLIAYMRSMGGGGSYTEAAPKLFAENCAACHKIKGEGGDMAPDLSLIGTARDKNYIKRYVTDPSKISPAATMPGFSGQLTDVQIEDLARYLAAQR